MCGYCTESMALEFATAEVELRRCDLLDGGHSLVLEQYVQEVSDLDAALALEAQFPLSVLCRRVEAAYERGEPLPPGLPRQSEVLGGWLIPDPTTALDTVDAEAAAQALEDFVAWWGQPSESITEGEWPAADPGRSQSFETMLPELWAALTALRLAGPAKRVMELGQKLVEMQHPATPSFEARELWLQRRAILAWSDAGGVPPAGWVGPQGIRPALLEYLTIRRPNQSAVPA